jgi:hypothetical protein
VSQLGRALLSPSHLRPTRGGGAGRSPSYTLDSASRCVPVQLFPGSSVTGPLPATAGSMHSMA